MRSATLAGVLQAAGFADIDFADVHEPVYYGPDTAAALAWVHGFAGTDEFLQRLDADGAVHALARLSDALAAHMSDEGVWFDSRAWIVTAHRR